VAENFSPLIAGFGEKFRCQGFVAHPTELMTSSKPMKLRDVFMVNPGKRPKFAAFIHRILSH